MSDVSPPPGIFVEVFSRLPVKSLLRFRCVSKPWRDLIDSDYLIKLHLNQSINDESNINLIFGGDSTLYYLDLDSPAKCLQKIDHPLSSKQSDTVVLGSCNGIICLSTTESDNDVVFWNPSTHRFKKVPLNPLRFPLFSVRRFCIEGFGYDKLNDDYKLVRLVQYCRNNINLVLEYAKIEIYSLKLNNWRKVGDFPYYICYQRNYSVFASGCLHWLVSQKPEPDVDYLIAAFDLTKEEYRLVPQPEFPDKGFKINLAVLGGCLCMVCCCPKEKVDIWVMKSHGVKESWTKLISTREAKVIKGLDYVRPILYSKSGEEVLMEKNFETLFWYDIAKKKVKRFRVGGMPQLFAADIFLGSLVRVNNGGASTSGAKEQMKEKKNTKRRDDFLSKGFRLVL